MEKLKNLINSTVGTEGALDIPAYWMNKILSDLQKLIKATNNKVDEHSTFLTDVESRVNSLESHSLFRLVPVLPVTPKEDIIYLVPSYNEVDGNTLAEWVYLNGAWEQFGEFKADIDLSNYVTKDALPKPDWDVDEYSANGIKNRTHYKILGTRINIGHLYGENPAFVTLEAGKEYEIQVSEYGFFRIKMEDMAAGQALYLYESSTRLIALEKLDVNKLPITHALKVFGDASNDVAYAIYNVEVKQLPEEYIPDTIARKSYVDNLNIPKTIVVEDSMLSTSSYVTNLYNTLIECDYTATVKYRENNKVYDCYLVNKDSNFESIYLMYATIYFDEVVSNKIRIYKNGECGKSKETFTNKHTIKTFSANDGNVLNGHYKGSNREGEVARFNWYSNNPDKNLDCNIEYVCKGGSLEFPNDIFWGDGQLPEFKKYHRYIININNQMGKFVEFYRKIRFTVDGEEFEFYLDATLENFINDGVDPNFEIGGQIENTNKFGVLYKGAKLLSEDNVEVSVSDLLIDGHNYVTQKANSLDDLIGTYNFVSSGTSLGSTKPTLSKNGNDIVFTDLLGGGPAVVVTFDETNNTITVPKGWNSTYVGPVDVDLTFQVDFDNHTLTLMNVPITVGGWANISKYILTKE